MNARPLICCLDLLPIALMEATQDTPVHPPTPPAERLVGLAYTTWFTSTNWHNVWSTPELGCYRSDDRAVIRKHAEWLADAGVDFIWVDWSNDASALCFRITSASLCWLFT